MKNKPGTKEKINRNNTGKKSVNSIYGEKQSNILEAISIKNDGNHNITMFIEKVDKMKSKILNNWTPDSNIALSSIHKNTKDAIEIINIDINGKFNSSGKVMFFSNQNSLTIKN